jgi:hypothetical protein
VIEENDGDCAALAARWPRQLIAEGRAERLARWWIASGREAEGQGRPGFARYPLSRLIRGELFEARRARRLVRGLEGAEKQLASEELGLVQTRVSESSSESARISRLLVVSSDGSERFYRQVNKLRTQFSNRLEVLVILCDEAELGSSIFGEGRRARAILLHHKESVVGLLTKIDREMDGTAAPKG